MNDRPPSLGAQIEAVELAELHAREIGRRARMREGEIELLVRRLQAAIETLQTLEQGRFK